MMEHHDFGDTELEGEPSCMWFLEKIAQTGLTPVARSRAWATESGVPAGDRSTFEHFVLMKVFQVAAEKDQLNLGCLESFELLARRAQVIESAHAFSASNPDYTHAEDMMGWGIQKGGALVSPALIRFAANKAAERSSILKEKRKFAEEMRLRKPRGGKGGEKGARAGGSKGTTPPEGGGAKK